MTVEKKVATLCMASPSAWAMAFRQIKNSIQNDIVTPYSFKGYPFLLDIHDAKAKKKTVIKGAQMGVTEVAQNVTFWYIDMHKKDVLYLLPNDGAASSFSASRFNPSLESSPRLAKLFTQTDNVQHKRAGMSNLYVRGIGTSAAGRESRQRGMAIKSIPVSIIILDEYDEMDKDRVTLADERVSGKKEYLIFKLSTPSIPNFGIDKEYKQSSMGLWMIKCPHCGEVQNLNLENLCQDRRSFVCRKKCKGAWTDEEKNAATENGFWVHGYPERIEKHAGFWLPQLYSPVQTAERLLEKMDQIAGDKIAEQGFYNFQLGMAHLTEGTKIEEAEVLSCKTSLPSVNRVDSNVSTVMGVDVGSKLHVTIFQVEGKKFIGLKTTTVKDFDDLDAFMNAFHIRIAVIDMLPETRMSRLFVKKWPGRAFMCLYGSSKELITIDEDHSRVIANRTETLDVTLARYRSKGELVSLPNDLHPDYTSHICSQVRLYERMSGGGNVNVPVYRETGPDHFCHSANYAEIAGAIWRKRGGGFISDQVLTKLQEARVERETSPNKMNW